LLITIIEAAPGTAGSPALPLRAQALKVL
jgi:hypothetical protein